MVSLRRSSTGPGGTCSIDSIRLPVSTRISPTTTGWGGTESVNDVSEANYGKWRHSISKYMGQPKLRSALSELLDL